MGQDFRFNIEAIDRFSKTFRDLNNKASQATRPIQSTYRQLGVLGREMHLDKLAAGVARVSALAPTMARNLGLSLGPLESMLGVGAAGGMLGTLGAAAGAIGVLTVKTAAAGFETARTAELLSLSTSQLQRFRGAALQSGVDVNTATSALSSLGETLKSAAFGRDPAALSMLSRLGVTIVRSKDGLVDVQATLEQIENVLHNTSSQQQRNTIADILHIPHDVLPMLEQGSQRMRELGDAARRYGYEEAPAAITASEELTRKLYRLQMQIEGTEKTWGSKFAPHMSRGLDKLSGDIDARGSFIAGLSWLNRTFSPAGALTDSFFVGKGNASGAAAPARAASAPALTASVAAGVRRGGGDPVASEVRLTPAEMAEQEAYDRSAANIAELQQEIARTRDPHFYPNGGAAARAELNKIMVEIQVRSHAGTGVTVDARRADGQPVDTRISYAMPGDGGL